MYLSNISWSSSSKIVGNENAHTISLSIARANELAFSTVAYIAAVLPPDFSYQLHTLWHRARRTLIVPLLRIAVMVCLVMSVMLLLEKLFMGLVSLLVKILRRKPKKLWKWESIKEDVELGSLAYPMVLVQIPLYNERQVEAWNIFFLVHWSSWSSERLTANTHTHTPSRLEPRSPHFEVEGLDRQPILTHP